MARRSFILHPQNGLLDQLSLLLAGRIESSENIPNPSSLASVASRSDALENEIQPVLEEPTMYSIESKSSTIGWAAIRMKMLSVEAITEIIFFILHTLFISCYLFPFPIFIPFLPSVFSSMSSSVFVVNYRSSWLRAIYIALHYLELFITHMP